MASSENPRINCCVPGCRRGTRKWPDGEIICGKCWRFVSRSTKRRKRMIAKLIRRLDERGFGKTTTITEALERRRAYRMGALVWRRCKAEAIQGAAGI